MKQSTLIRTELHGIHVAIIMDGNGRWATQRGLPRVAGHQAGVETVRRIVEAAPSLGINILTLYAFSSDNWKRPAPEVTALMQLLRIFLKREAMRCARQGVRLEVLGRRDRLPAAVVEEITRAETLTRQGTRLHLRIAVDYSSRDAILQAVQQVATLPELTRDTFATLLGQVHNSQSPAPDVDLLIRTSGEQRLSDFLLWECAYAEFFFTKSHWPDFQPAELEAAVSDFRRRDRRFGALPQAVAS
ncbi:MAG TPA: di-trans,poly-cis-decaprenylcistransferase [Acidobacteriota bacterium]|nr:di-trans,poly-cis-decaprenylcistransferase [Acidobacteriota bacterium]HNB71772.1 di-trans,poly-cis-decaprenylcistransferase [Acidobacteriota bacterium]HNH83820.1 di-trans,poly-cis-decaprenylcistransferase [Acidobacteriota bacterium]